MSGETSSPRSPLQVGNGNFAFGADITGLQTFVPFNTLSHWGWHNAALPPGPGPAEFRGAIWDTHGRPVRYPSPDPEQPALSQWLYANPIGSTWAARSTLVQGQRGGRDDDDLADVPSEHWTSGMALFQPVHMEGQRVRGTHLLPPDPDAIAVRIESPLFATKRLSVFLDFPRDEVASSRTTSALGAATEQHHTQAWRRNPPRAHI